MRPHALLLPLLLAAGCPRASTSPDTPTTTSTLTASATVAEGQPRLGPLVAEGLASRYADSLAGRATASGEPYDPQAFTCAHRRLRLGTRLHVRRKKTGQTVVCRVNDRGPFHERRILDLSRAAAEALGFEGVARVEVRRVLKPE